MDRLKKLIVLVLLVANFGTMKAEDDSTPSVSSNTTVGPVDPQDPAKLETSNSPNITQPKSFKTEEVKMDKNILKDIDKIINTKIYVDAKFNRTTSTVSSTTDIMDLMTYMQDDNAAGAKSKARVHGDRHIKAHDGFHNIKKEKYWAHWNDAFTTPK